jgi:hypothetical protein
MKHFVRITTFALILAAATVVGFGQKDEESFHRFSGTALDTQGGIPETVFLNIKITRFTSDAEVEEYINILKTGGTDALRKKLAKVKVGRVWPSAGLGNDVAVARARKTEKGYLVTFVTARRFGFFEVFNSGRSMDYPFGFIQIQFDENGKGKGEVIVATKFSFNKKKHFQITSYGRAPYRLVNGRHK